MDVDKYAVYTAYINQLCAPKTSPRQLLCGRTIKLRKILLLIEYFVTVY